MPSAKQLDRHDDQLDEPASLAKSSGSGAVDPTVVASAVTRAGSKVSVTGRHGLRRIAVPLMLVTSSMVMALAWLGHLRFTEWPFAQAMFICWLLVLPEYLLNISAIRLGYHVYSGAQMAAFRLCSGVVCVALVSAWVIGETLTTRQLGGFALMIVALALISVRQHDRFVDEEQQSVDNEQLNNEQLDNEQLNSEPSDDEQLSGGGV